jgi:DNA-directed RNA polymerase specialized sigma24 family protein
VSNLVNSRVQTQLLPRMPGPNLKLARQLCRRHARPLLAMALLILDDVDAASEIVVDALVAASRRTHAITPGADRVRAILAASVYRRCVGSHVVRERFGLAPTGRTVPDTDPMMPLTGLNVRQRCTIALALFGGHSLSGAARTLRLEPADVLRQMGDALAAMSSATDGGMWNDDRRVH